MAQVAKSCISPTVLCLSKTSEGLYIDYRYFDKHKVEPRFECGFGLSYTTFALSNLQVKPRRTKSALPAPRTTPAAQPPAYPTEIPSKNEALFPPGLRRLEKYIYPYLKYVGNIKIGPYPNPDGYDQIQPLSDAGGDEGGNPDLWSVYVDVDVDVTNSGSLAGQGGLHSNCNCLPLNHLPCHDV